MHVPGQNDMQRQQPWPELSELCSHSTTPHTGSPILVLGTWTLDPEPLANTSPPHTYRRPHFGSQYLAPGHCWPEASEALQRLPWSW